MELENKFKNGKIYKIVDTNNNKSYYGSTIQRLSMRMALHRKAYKDYKDHKFNKLNVFKFEAKINSTFLIFCVANFNGRVFSFTTTKTG